MRKCSIKGKSPKPHGLRHLRNLRQQKGLSLGQLSDLTGIRRNIITHLEDGRVDPQPHHVRLLARVLEVPQLDLT
jgi:transcriptional regulator with XRE-family HTH domain